MAGPIYKAFSVSYSEAWYHLSKDEQQSLMAKVGEALTKVAGTSVALCESGWASEEWQFFGVEIYPSIEAVQEHHELLKAIDWFRYIKSSTLLGTATTV